MFFFHFIKYANLNFLVNFSDFIRTEIDHNIKKMKDLCLNLDERKRRYFLVRKKNEDEKLRHSICYIMSRIKLEVFFTIFSNNIELRFKTLNYANYKLSEFKAEKKN